MLATTTSGWAAAFVCKTLHGLQISDRVRPPRPMLYTCAHGGPWTRSCAPPAAWTASAMRSARRPRRVGDLLLPVVSVAAALVVWELVSRRA